jgi:hypothetical protein
MSEPNQKPLYSTLNFRDNFCTTETNICTLNFHDGIRTLNLHDNLCALNVRSNIVH